MPDREDYRRRVASGALWAFFGLLTAVVSPDLGLGLGRFFAFGGAVAFSLGAYELSGLPITGLYRPLMTAGASFGGLYCAALAVLILATGGAATMPVREAHKTIGALALLSVAGGMEIFARRLKWHRLAHGWAITEAAVGVAYAAPALFGLFSPFYASGLEASRVISVIYYELVDFNFHGMSLPGAPGGPKWLMLLHLTLFLPAAAVLVNFLRTYVRAATPPRAAEPEPPIQWSRR